MKELPTRLPVRPTPQPDETFSSWLVRLSATNGLRTRSLCSLTTARQVEFGSDVDGPAGSSLQRLLAVRAGHDPHTFELRHTLMGFAGVLFPEVHRTKATRWVLPFGALYTTRPAMQYCSLCLGGAAPAYYRRIWRLSLFAVCPSHGIGLRHVCHHCASPVHPIRNDLCQGAGALVLCWKCGSDLRGAPVVPVPAEDARLSSDLLRILGGGPPIGPTGMDARTFFDGLALVGGCLLRRSSRLLLWRQLAAEAAGIGELPAPVDRRAGTSFDSLCDPVQRQTVLRVASWLLESWPGRFLDLACSARTRTSDFVSGFVTAPAWFLEPLQTRLTPPRRKPVPSSGVMKERRKRQFIFEHRREWSPSKLPRLIRALRAAGYYSPETDDAVIMRSLPKTIARLRVEGADYRRRLTRQVERGTPEWSRLIVLAKPYRKVHCHKAETLRRGIRLLCAHRFLSSADLGELLHRSHVVLMVHHLTPMVRAGELETRFASNKGGARNFPGQAYRSLPLPTGDPGCMDNLPRAALP